MARHGYVVGGIVPPEYRAWQNLKSRCLNPRMDCYADYGGRGITVCSTWCNSFTTFIADMGPRPPGMTLERIDNDRGYSKENCAWRSMKEQNNNRRPRSVYPPRDQ